MAEPTPETPLGEEEGGPVKSFLEHLEDLRWMLIKCCAVLGIGMVVAGAATNWILWAMRRPLAWAKVVQDPDRFLTSLGPADAFFIITQVALMGGAILALPFMIYFILDFITPALRVKERRYLLPSLLVGIVLFMTGVAFCYFGILPVSLRVAYQLSMDYLGIKPEWRIQSYLSFVLWMILGMGLSFELPVVLVFLVKIGLLQARQLRKGWRVALVGCLIFSAVITPTGDPFTMSLFAVPLYLLYEVSVWIAYWMERRERRREERAASSQIIGLP